MAILNFDATNVDPNVALDPVPAGWYSAKITSSEMKPTKDGAGAYLQLTLQVLEGQHMNRTFFDRLNLQNTNPTAVEIAQKTLSAICHSTGVFQVQDSSQLHGYPLQVKVSVKPADANYSASNEVKGYRCIDGSTPGSSTSRPAAGPTSAPAMAPVPTPPCPMPQPPVPPQQYVAPQIKPTPYQAPAAPIEQPQQAVVPQAPVAQQAPAGTPVPPWARQA